MRRGCCFLYMLLICVFFLNADKTNLYSYGYGPDGIICSAPAFMLAMTINSDENGKRFGSVNAVCSGGGKVYFSDNRNSVIHILDGADYTYSGCIFNDDFTDIQGIFYNETRKELYIADAGSESIFVLDGAGYSVKRIICKPDNMAGITQFKPYRIVSDSAGRMYIVVAGSYEGIIELKPDGEFSRYYGVNKPEISLIDYFWRLIASNRQKRMMVKNYAPSFSGIDIDKDGFVYAATGDTASEKMIFRFNAKGENVIREDGYIPLKGDVSRFFLNNHVASAFSGISVTEFGVYSVLDRNSGRVFVYDFDGYMLSVFSRIGDMKGDLRSPSDISWNRYDIIVGDIELGVLNVYIPTEFGKAALLASERYQHGDWENAGKYFREALNLNSNYYAGYSGLGRNYLMQLEYKNAMEYLEKAGDTKMYSRAFNLYRGVLIRKYSVFIILLIIFAVAGILFTEIRYLSKNKEISGGADT